MDWSRVSKIFILGDGASLVVTLGDGVSVGVIVGVVSKVVDTGENFGIGFIVVVVIGKVVFDSSVISIRLFVIACFIEWSVSFKIVATFSSALYVKSPAFSGGTKAVLDTFNIVMMSDDVWCRELSKSIFGNGIVLGKNITVSTLLSLLVFGKKHLLHQ